MERWTLDIGQKIGYEGTGFFAPVGFGSKGNISSAQSMKSPPPSALKILEILKTH